MSMVGAIASWLLEVYALATIVLTVAALAMLALKQPAQRLSVARATFVLLALLGPLVAACRWTRAARTFETAQATPTKLTLPTAFDACCAPASLGTTPDVVPNDRRPALMVGILAAGAALAVGWLVLGAIASARLRLRSRPAPERLQAILARVAGQGGTTPRLLVGTGVAQPVAFGLFRPAIVLPERFAEAEPGPRIEAALAHEWAHIQNGDLRHLALARVLLPLLFAHPLFAWLRRRARADQEALADLAASRHGGRVAYAEALLNWARSGAVREIERKIPVLGLWDRPSALHHRIALLLDGDSRLETRCSPRWRIALGALTIAGLAGLGGIALGGTIVGPFEPSCDGSPRPHRHTHASGVLVRSNLEVQAVQALYCCPTERERGL